MSVTHGGVQPEELAALGLDPAAVVDLSANLHPAGPDPRVLEAARSASLDRYPSPDAAPLREAIAAAHALDPACVLVTPGATAAIHLVARAFLRERDRCAILGPAFGEYAAATRACNAEPVEVRAHAPSFEPAWQDARLAGVPLSFVCQPNNPTGVALDAAALAALAARSRLLVVDEAYADFAPGVATAEGLVAAGAPVVVVRSMTKLHAVPGLRLGYLIAAPPVIRRLAHLLPSWSVDAASLAAGLVAVGQHEERVALLAGLADARARLREACASAGWATTDARANFVVARTGDASATRAALLREGFAVRDCTSFGLPEWVRIAVPAPAHLDRLTRAIEHVAAVRA
ncbi:MAG: threonine-phosphate decarboxylase [Chloroflexota bacterium]